MAISKVKPSGWAFGEILTSAQMNTLDTDHAKAVDKSVGALEIDSSSYGRVCSDVGTIDVPADWGISQGVWSTGTTGLRHIYFSFQVPNGATITIMKAYLKGAGGHGALPATMPQARAYKVSISDGSATLLGSATNDPSGTTGAFQAAHEIAVTMTEVVDSTTYRYLIDVSTETGANSIAGALYIAGRASVTVASLDPARA